MELHGLRAGGRRVWGQGEGAALTCGAVLVVPAAATAAANGLAGGGAVLAAAAANGLVAPVPVSPWNGFGLLILLVMSHGT